MGRTSITSDGSGKVTYTLCAPVESNVHGERCSFILRRDLGRPRLRAKCDQFHTVLKSDDCDGAKYTGENASDKVDNLKRARSRQHQAKENTGAMAKIARTTRTVSCSVLTEYNTLRCLTHREFATTGLHPYLDLSSAGALAPSVFRVRSAFFRGKCSCRHF